jgi:hypothetical protein
MKGISSFLTAVVIPMKVKGMSRIILPFFGLIILIFLLAILLFPEIQRNISRTLSKLGVIQPIEVVPEEIEIETVSVKEEQEEREIGKPIKWRKELIVTNPSSEEVKDYEVTGIPEDAKNIIVKDVAGRTLYTDKTSWKIDIPGKVAISYFVEYETPAPYKEEFEIQPFVPGRKYVKRIAVKSDFIGHYQNVKAYTDVPEELFQENFEVRLYRITGNSRIDITENPSYKVKFVDSDKNGLNDRIEWNIPILSEEEFEVKAGITIINVQSYPTVLGNWTVRFNTTGKADLTITPINDTNFDVDIKFLELRCGDNIVNPFYDGKSVFFADWECIEEGRIINKVLKEGKHTLEFRYGDDVEYAYNLATLEKAMIAYRSNTGANGLNSPKVRVWNNETGWGSEIELDSAGSPVRFVRLAFSPISPKRIIVTQSDDGYLDAYASSDGNTWIFSSNIGYVGVAAQRRFDVEFETATGDAMVVYSIVDADASHDLAYKVLPADTLSFSGISEQYINDDDHTSDIQYTWVALDRNPLSSSEEIILAGFDSTDSDINAWVWNGNNWGNRAEISSSATATGGYEALAVKYASDGSKGMVIGGDGTVGNVNAQYWNGFSWVVVNIGDLDPTDGWDTGWLTLKADPSTDDLMAVSIDSGRDLHAIYWNGASWSITANIDITVDVSTTRCADFAWNPSGNSGILIWDTDGAGTTLSYRTCSPQCTEATSTISAYAGTGRWIQAVTNPRNEDDTKILIGRLNSNNDIGAINRSSTAFSNYGDAAITADTTVTTYEAFDISFLFIEPILSFNITLPGLAPIQASGVGSLTIPIEFNASSPTDLKVQPCVVGYGCDPGFKQDASMPIFTFTNTGNVVEQWNISLSESLSPYGITLYGNTSSDPTLHEITPNGWIASSNIPVGSSVQVWLWADFVDSPAGSVGISITHSSLLA